MHLSVSFHNHKLHIDHCFSHAGDAIHRSELWLSLCQKGKIGTFTLAFISADKFNCNDVIVANFCFLSLLFLCTHLSSIIPLNLCLYTLFFSSPPLSVNLIYLSLSVFYPQPCLFSLLLFSLSLPLHLSQLSVSKSLPSFFSPSYDLTLLFLFLSFTPSLSTTFPLDHVPDSSVTFLPLFSSLLLFSTTSDKVFSLSSMFLWWSCEVVHQVFICKWMETIFLAHEVCQMLLEHVNELKSCQKQKRRVR